MKKSIHIIVASFFLLIGLVDAQNVGINTDSPGTAPNASAALDLTSTSKGFLMPRLTNTERNAILSPATGLMFYNISTNKFNVFNGTNWVELVPTIISGATVSTTANTDVTTSLGGAGFTPDASAVLHLQGESNNTGLLLPRMTTVNRDAVSSPATGLLIYNTTNARLEYYNGSSWSQPLCGATLTIGGVPAAGTNSPGANASINTTGTAADNSSVLDITSSSKGLLIPRLTDAQRNALPSPAIGLLIYNTSTNLFNYYNGGQWYYILNAAPSSAPTVAAATSVSYASFTANWSAVSDATEYFIDVDNNSDFSSLTLSNVSVGNVTSYNVTGIPCATTYYYRVRAANSCGSGSNSASITVSLTSSLTFTYRGGSVTYGIVPNNTTLECWLDRNLGATQVATSVSDAASYGDMFQWGRLSDNHQARTSTTTATTSAGDTPGHANFITCAAGNIDWRTTFNDNLWQGVSGTNNPCPTGWRLPTEAEYTAEIATWSSADYNGAYASNCKFPSGGARAAGSAAISSAGTLGAYWTYTVLSANANPRRLNFSSVAGSAAMTGTSRAWGLSVRCILN